MSGIHSLRTYQKCIHVKDLSLQDCINICQAKDAIRIEVQECRPESVNSIQSAQTMIPVHRLQHSSKQSSNFNRHKNKSGPESTLRYARLRTLFVVNVARRGTLTHYLTMQKQQDTHTHVRGTRLQSSTVSGVSTRL